MTKDNLMIKSPRTLGCIHFVGIGGIGMSGIAEVLQQLGLSVSGSDIAMGANVKRLMDLGIPIVIGHRRETIKNIDTLVISSAVKDDNPELIEAKRQGLPIIKRAEMLAELMRFKWSIAVGGTHGKTTTTSLIAHLLVESGLDPTIINGGIINSYDTNAKLGRGDWLVAEADESDGTFLHYPATIAVVTNIDPEHLDHYGTFENVVQAFEQFVLNVPFYGFAVLCLDHPIVQKLIAQITGRKIISYGLSAGAAVRASQLRVGDNGIYFNITRQIGQDNYEFEPDILINMYGEHNVKNATAAIATAREMGIGWDIIRRGLANFSGVKRRFTTTGIIGGVRIIDDYGHHPVEIAAVLSAARSCTKGRVIAVMQPHRYSRLNNLMDEFSACFVDADEIIIADVYSAGELPMAGVTSDILVEKIIARGFRRTQKLSSPDHLAQLLKNMIKPDDIVVCLGAGDITKWAYQLPAQLASIF